ncbi:hypothetical protein PG997_005140 [Apiospora hydei]|uniref:Uncharacterized protein n=1 Tax=Apiospora hydei TaxID=1337664 RepID=A0ABR1X486_9PEZI
MSDSAATSSPAPPSKSESKTPQQKEEQKPEQKQPEQKQPEQTQAPKQSQPPPPPPKTDPAEEDADENVEAVKDEMKKHGLIEDITKKLSESKDLEAQSRSLRERAEQLAEENPEEADKLRAEAGELEEKAKKLIKGRGACRTARSRAAPRARGSGPASRAGWGRSWGRWSGDRVDPDDGARDLDRGGDGGDSWALG